MLRQLIIYLLSILLLTSCVSKESSLPVYKVKYHAPCQIFGPKDTVYSFSAKVLDIKHIYKYNTRELRNFSTTRLVATTVSVSKGRGLSVNQAIFIDLAVQTARCDIGETCDFVAPSSYLSDITGSVLVVDALVIQKY